MLAGALAETGVAAKRFETFKEKSPEPAPGAGRFPTAMPSKSDRQRPEPILSTGAGERMTPAQQAELRALAEAAYEPQAFSEQLTQTQAAERIAMLKAKLKLLDAPPHTL